MFHTVYCSSRYLNQERTCPSFIGKYTTSERIMASIFMFCCHLSIKQLHAALYNSQNSQVSQIKCQSHIMKQVMFLRTKSKNNCGPRPGIHVYYSCTHLFQHSQIIGFMLSWTAVVMVPLKTWIDVILNRRWDIAHPSKKHPTWQK